MCPKRLAKQKELRTHAEEKLRDGSAPPTSGWLTNQDALNLLHALASDPESATDALKLLHELQVHQVELDLQLEQLEANERELTEDLVHCARLYDFAPVACFSINLKGQITRVNRAGAALCGEDREKLIGRQVDDFLMPESREVLQKLSALVRKGGADENCEVHTLTGDVYNVKAGLVPGESSILTCFVNLTNSTKPYRQT